MAVNPRRYSVIFYACLLITVVLVGIMLFSDPPAEAVSQTTTSHSASSIFFPSFTTTVATTSETVKPKIEHMTLHWSAEDIRAMFSQAMKDTFPEAEIKWVELREPNICTIYGRLPRESIATIAKAAGIELSNAAQIALKLAPAVLDLHISFTVDVTDGNVAIEPAVLTTEGIDLPVSLLPQSAKSAINTVITEALAKEKCTLQDFFISGGLLYLECEIEK